MIVLNVNRLSLSFGTNEIFSDVTFSLNENDRLGVIGVNGCGKSTLFKAILGEYTADEGEVFIAKETSLGVLRQDGAFADFNPDDRSMSALEVMYTSFPELIEAEKRLSELEYILGPEVTA